MARRVRTLAAVLSCVLASMAACSSDPEPTAAPGGTAVPSVGTSSAAVPGASGTTTVAPPVTDPSAPPVVTGTTKPPGGGGVAAAPPPCTELKPVLDKYLSGVRLAREAPGSVTTCFVIGQFQGAPVEAQLQYGHTTADKTLRKAAGVDCAAEVRPLELNFKKALGCDNATATVHSAVALAQGSSFAASIITVTGGPAGTANSRALVSSTAEKLATEVLTQIG